MLCVEQNLPDMRSAR